MAVTDQTRIRRAMGMKAKSFDEIVRVTGLPPARARQAIGKLVRRGRLCPVGDGYVKAGALR
jgi:hypothetical protein